MANWYGAARSNYFEVENYELFEKFCSVFNLNIFYNSDDKIGIHTDQDDWPSTVFFTDKDDDCLQVMNFLGISEDNDEYEFEFHEILSKFLKEDEVAILLSSGAEKLRYITGYAIAVNSKGETRQVCLSDIYDLAKELTNKKDEITRAEY